MGLPLLAFCLTKKAGGCHCLRLFKKRAGGCHCLLFVFKKKAGAAIAYFCKRRQGLPLLAFLKGWGLQLFALCL